MIPYEDLEVTVETLGTGTFGVVIKGVYLGTEVAIKKIKLDEDMKLVWCRDCTTQGPRDVL